MATRTEITVSTYTDREELPDYSMLIYTISSIGAYVGVIHFDHYDYDLNYPIPNRQFTITVRYHKPMGAGVSAHEKVVLQALAILKGLPNDDPDLGTGDCHAVLINHVLGVLRAEHSDKLAIIAAR